MISISNLFFETEIIPSPANKFLYDNGMDKFSAGTKTYNDAMKSILASSEKLPKGEIKPIVQSSE